MRGRILDPNAPGAGNAAATPGRHFGTATERALCALWRDLLNADEIGAGDNFFDRGGHSLLATQLVARIRSDLGAELPLRAVFEEPSLAALAARVEVAQPVCDEPQLVARHGTGPVPLSFSQERMWAEARREPWAYTLPCAVRLQQCAVDRGALEDALNELVERHEALRTRFVPDSRGSPVQVVDPPSHVDIRCEDLVGGQQACARRLQTEIRTSFDLERGPLMRPGLLRLSERDYVPFLIIHHIIGDARSVEIVVDEIAALYRSRVGGPPPALPELTIQYPDFALWQRGRVAGPAFERDLAYWRVKLADPPPALELPSDRARPSAESFQGALYCFRLPGTVATELRRLARREDATLFMVLLAGFKAFLARHSQQRDLIVGAPIAGRTRAELEGVVGNFVNRLALRTDLSGGPTFRELIARVRAATIDAVAHQELPFSLLTRVLALRDKPLFHVMFGMRREAIPEPGTGLSQELMVVPIGVIKVDFGLVVIETRSGVIEAFIDYSIDLFDADTIRRFARAWVDVLREMASDADGSAVTG